MLKTSIIPRRLHFKKPAGTSRGTYTTRQVWYIVVSDRDRPEHWGIGECAPLPGLSCDERPGYQEFVTEACALLERTGTLDAAHLRPWPSVLFGFETAMAHFQAGTFALWNTPFSRGQEGITINGLIWMDDAAAMLRQVEDKLESGFKCIKLKIGAIGFEEEIGLIRHIRRHFAADEIELRVDANGAFNTADVLDKLGRLAECEIHSIEQPIMPGQWDSMADLCQKSPVPIALDEELIGLHGAEEKHRLLQAVKPQYIILKPSLHGSISGCNEWIEAAACYGTNWWATSALESNIGLNAIAQWTATHAPTVPQGLGTGALFTDNVCMPLEIRRESLWYDPQGVHYNPFLP